MAARHLAFANTYQTKPQDYQDANSTQCVAEPAAAIVARLDINQKITDYGQERNNRCDF
jgi:hypothetical protein